MTVSDIIGKILSNQIEGLMFHEQMGEYYRFLGMKGYAEVHDWHYSEEDARFRFMRNYYLEHYDMLPKYSANAKSIIPDAWYKYKREEVDTNTKRNAVRNGLELWKEWEIKTKALYQDLYSELVSMKEIAFACNVNSLIMDVDKELADVMTWILSHKSDDYDIANIMAQQ